MGVLFLVILMFLFYYGLLWVLKDKIFNLKNFMDGKEVMYVKKMVFCECRVFMIVFIMLMVFFVVWGLFVVVDFVFVFCENCWFERLFLVWDIMLIVGFFLLGINFGLYVWWVLNFRYGLMFLFWWGLKFLLRFV